MPTKLIQMHPQAYGVVFFPWQTTPELKDTKARTTFVHPKPPTPNHRAAAILLTGS